jgi:hypothetical protein
VEKMKVDWGKWFKSFFEAVPWVKTLRYAVGIAIISGVVIGFTWVIIRFKPQTQKIDLRGNTGKVTINQTPRKYFIPFVEPYIQKDSGSGFDTGIRAGMRFEF